MAIFFVLFLVVRGTPALLLYRRVLDRRERVALALMSSTQLPLVLAITTVATDSGHMRRRRPRRWSEPRCSRRWSSRSSVCDYVAGPSRRPRRCRRSRRGGPTPIERPTRDRRHDRRCTCEGLSAQ